MAYGKAGMWGPEVVLNGSVTTPLPLPATSITVKNMDGSAATCYTDRTAVTTTSNVIVTDSMGQLTFFAMPGQYKLHFTNSLGAQMLPITVHLDPADLAPDVFASATYVPARVVFGLGGAIDQTSAITTAITQAAAAGGPCKVLLHGDIATAGGHVVPENVAIEGLGHTTTTVTHTGNNTCFTALGNTDFWESPQFRGFHLVGNTGVAAVGIHSGNNYQQMFQDLIVTGYSGTDGVGVWLENTVLYSESVMFLNVHIQNCKTNLRLSRSGTGTESFSSARFYGLTLATNVPDGIMLDIQAGIWLYGAAFGLKLHSSAEAVGCIGIKLATTAKVFGGGGFIHFEGTTGYGLVAPDGSQFEMEGTFFAESVNHLIGGVVVSGRQGQAQFVGSGDVLGPVTSVKHVVRQESATPQSSRVVTDLATINPTLKFYRWTGGTNVHFPFHVVLGDGRADLSSGSGAVPGAEVVTPVVSVGNAALGFFNTAPINKPAIGGSRGGNAALASLLTNLANLGLITDTTTA